MKKVLIFYALLVVVIVAFALSRGTNLLNFGGNGGGSSNVTAAVGGKTYKLILAKTDIEKQKGLSGRSSLPSDSGMLFVFENKDTHAFWMRDMKFPIDIIWIDENKVVDFVENVPAPAANQDPTTLPIYKPAAAANYVLEVNAHEITKQKIKKGDTVTLKGVK